MSVNKIRRFFPNVILLIVLLATSFAFLAPSAAFAAPPEKEEYFICPSVSTHNQNGMWVMGEHGVYYVIIPTQGGANGGSKVFLTVPVSVPDKAQVPAGWALYKDVDTYPNFEGMVMLLGEGIDTWLGNPPGWVEGDIAKVINNGDGSYTVMNMGPMSHPPVNKGSVIITQPIPLASAAVW